MNNMDISLLLKKAEELRALFVLGQRVIPFLEEIFLFVSEIKPLIDDINTSIVDNLRKMPNASKQLSKVTEATERSTTEILDIVDGVVYKSDIIANNLKKLADINSQNRKSPVKILELISQVIGDVDEFKELQPHLNNSINTLKTSKDTDFSRLLDDSEKLLTSIKDDSSSIMFSLQVQDITSQQIAAVNHLLETIQGKLGKILTKFQNTEINELVSMPQAHDEKSNVSMLHRSIAFDPDAVNSLAGKSGSRQNEVDNVMQQHLNAVEAGIEDLDVPTSQDDIDAMFQSQKDIILPGINNIDEPTSQDDIDAMFQSKKVTAVPKLDDLDVATSQEDIDAMFSSFASTQTDKKKEDSNKIEQKKPNISQMIDEGDGFEQVSQDDIDAIFHSI